MRKRSTKQAQRRKNAGLVDAVIDGERVLLATNTEPLEKIIQLRIVSTLTALGVRVLQHRIFPCVECGKRPPLHAGLGRYFADILCCVPVIIPGWGVFGRFVTIEVKRPSTRNRKKDAPQRKLAANLRRYGAVSGVATCEAEALALVEEARKPNALVALPAAPRRRRRAA